MTPEDVQLYYQIGLLGRRDLPLAPDARGGFEMVLLRMLAFRPLPVGTQTTAPAAPAARPVPAPTAATGRAAEPAPRASAPTPAAPASTPAPGSTAAVADSDDWEALVNALNLSGMLQQLAANCALGQRDGNNFQLTMSPNHKYLLNKSREDGLAQALSQYLGQPVTVNISLAGATTATPAERQQERADARQSQAEAVINSDDTVQAIMDAFDGQLKPGSVQPID